jgi:hypothetical protein
VPYCENIVTQTTSVVSNIIINPRKKKIQKNRFLTAKHTVLSRSFGFFFWNCFFVLRSRLISMCIITYVPQLDSETAHNVMISRIEFLAHAEYDEEENSVHMCGVEYALTVLLVPFS